jgi:3-oxoacyl-[acyl-carrier protein] reductase
MAVAFARRGYAVGVHYFQDDTAARAVETELSALKAPTFLVKADVRSSADVNGMIEQTAQELGRLDVLVCNAGLVRNRTVAKMSNDEWDDVIAADLSGPFYCMRAAVPLLRKQGGGSIVNIASLTAQRGARGAGNYAAAKAGLIALTKSIAQEEGANNIRANAIMPGFHVTDINRDYWEKSERSIRDQHSLPNLPERDELASFVVHVAELKSVTGQVLPFESRVF